MTFIRFYRDSNGELTGFSAIGHAGAADEGEDIVCAGISALTITAINSLEDIAKVEMHLHVGDGFASVRLCKKQKEHKLSVAQVILKTVQRGFNDMAVSYPQYMRIS